MAPLSLYGPRISNKSDVCQIIRRLFPHPADTFYIRNYLRNERENTRAAAIFNLLEFARRAVEWQSPEMKNVPFAGRWQGPEAVGQFFSKVFGVQDLIGI
jgi:hypothetical protein